MLTQHNPPSPSSNERTSARRGMLPQPEKKPEKKLETPVVVAMISAAVTLITSLLGSPILLSMINKADSPAPTPAAEIAISRSSILPGNAAGEKLVRATYTPAARTAGVVEFTPTSQGETPASSPTLLEPTLTAPALSPTLPEPTLTAPALSPKEPDLPTPEARSFFQCIAADLWFPYPTTLNPEINAGCWNLADWGFSTDQGRLLLVHIPGQDQQRGIYTPISGDVDIHFNVQLNEFRTRTKKVGVLNFGIVQNDPFSIYTGGYLSYQKPEPGAGSPVRVLISGSNQATQKIKDLEAGFQHEVLFTIKDDLMLVYLDGLQIGDPVNLPPADRAFWIGYVLPAKGELEMIISNFTIQAR